MAIETTINIHCRILGQIENASKILNKPGTYIIRMLLGKILHDERMMNSAWYRIRYQARDIPENWHIFHITLREDEYDFSQDLRKVYKMSLSHVVAYAVDKFLDQILSELAYNGFSKNTDKYLYRNYVISYRNIDGIHSWRYYWGFTPHGLVPIQAGDG